MMRRHFISVAMGSILVLLLSGGIGAPGLWAADSKAIKAIPPAAPAGGSGGSTTKAVSAPPAGSPAGSTAKAVSAPPAGRPGGPLADPLPAVALPPAPAYEYNATGKSDPFEPFMETDPVMKAKKEEELRKKAESERPISPLQQVDIEQLHLVGIAGDDRRRTAIVEDGVAKKHYPLSVGTYIGMNGGQIVSIGPDRVIIEERLPGQSPKAKKPKVKRITVMLHKEDEGKP
jgi:type IV pilus assembly protein PilP